MKHLLALFALCACAADWPQFLGPTRDGVSAETAVLTEFPTDGPKIAWKMAVGSGWSGPVVADGKVILFHRVENQEIVDCLDATNGKSIWKHGYRTRYEDDFRFDEGPRATPLITDGKVITFGADGDLQALEFATGKELWKRNVNKDYDVTKGYFGAACSPIRVGNFILMNVGGRNAGVVAFDFATGKEVWKTSNDKASYSSPTVAKFDGRERAVFFTRSGLLGIDPTNGEVKFSKEWRPRIDASVNAATPLVHKNQIFISTSYQRGAIVLEVKNDDLTEIWASDDVLSNHYNTSVRHKEHLFGINGRQEQKPALTCIDWKTGKLEWSKDRFGCAVLIVVGDAIVAIAEPGDLVIFAADPKAYRELARAKVLESPVRAAPAFANGKLYARDGKTMVCVDLGK